MEQIKGAAAGETIVVNGLDWGALLLCIVHILHPLEPNPLLRFVNCQKHTSSSFGVKRWQRGRQCRHPSIESQSLAKARGVL